MRPIPIALAAFGGTMLALSDLGGSTLVIARLAIAGVALGGAAAIDLAEHRIPNRLVLPAVAACVAITVSSGLNTATVVGLGVVALLLAIGVAVPSTVGMGDIKLMLVVVLGLHQSALRALFLALILASLAGVATVISKGRDERRNSLPLAPFLALGSLLAVI